MAICLGLPRRASRRRHIHPLTPMLQKDSHRQQVMAILHCESNKQDTELLPVLSPKLTNFQNSFTDRLTGKFATNSYLNIPTNLKYVTTLPREISMFKKLQCSRSI